MLDHNEAQLDFILEMYARDHPRELRLVRPDRLDAKAASSVNAAAWANVLSGSSYDNYMKDFLPSEAVLSRLRRVQPTVRVHPSIAGTVPVEGSN
jgi:hypothetical protein